MEASVVGRNCRIGRGAHLRGAYLLDGVAVGASAWVLGALVANGARVGDGAIVSPGAMLSFNARAPAPRLAAMPGSLVARAPSAMWSPAESAAEGLTLEKGALRCPLLRAWGAWALRVFAAASSITRG